MIPTYLGATLGGVLSRLSSGLFLLLDGRVSGISSIVAGLMRSPPSRWLSNPLFVAGLVLGPVLFRAAFHGWPLVRTQGSFALFVAAGLLVGFGTRLGSGCTSGHGVCGLARLSPRSAVAVATFMLAAIATVVIMRGLT